MLSGGLLPCSWFVLLLNYQETGKLHENGKVNFSASNKNDGILFMRDDKLSVLVGFLQKQCYSIVLDLMCGYL